MHITMRDAATKITDWALSRENLTEERRAQIYKARVYNTLATLFNASTVMLVIGVASAIFLAMSSAFVFLVLGLFLRTTTEKEIDKYTQPVPEQQAQEPEAPSGAGARAWAILRSAFQAERQTRLLEHALNQTTDEAKVKNIFEHVGLDEQSDFAIDEVLLFGFAGWKNPLTIPEMVVQRRTEEGARQEERADTQSAATQSSANAGIVGAAAGRLANLARRIVGAGAAAASSADAVYNGESS